MKNTGVIRALGTIACASAALLAAPSSEAQHGAPNGEWPTYGGDLGNTRYSALAQIDASNFKDLEVAWRFKTDNLGPTREYNFQSTPLMVDGVVYSTAGSRRAVIALDAGNGELLWVHRLDEGERGQVAPRQLSGRGLAYWQEGDDARIVYVTPGYQMIALDARTGERIAELRPTTASSTSSRTTTRTSIRSTARSACTRRRSWPRTS